MKHFTIVRFFVFLFAGAANAQAPFTNPNDPRGLGAPSFYDKYQSTPGQTDYFSPQGDHTTVYQMTPGMSQYFTQDKNGTGYVFDHSAYNPLTMPPPNATSDQLYDWVNGRR